VSSGRDFWRNEEPTISLGAFFTARLEEATGLAPGWVSSHGDRRVQKQANGEWIYVPSGTPLGMQPFFKKTIHTPKEKGSNFGAKANVDELMSFLNDAGFNDPKKRAALLKNANWYTGVLKKFGNGWFQKATAAEAAALAAAQTPTEGPTSNARPPSPAETSNSLDFALQKLGYSAGSPQAFALAQFHKKPGINSDTVAEMYRVKFGKKNAAAIAEVEALIDAAKAKGLITVKGDFESGLTVTFIGGAGPVMSAPVVAATASVSAAPPKKAKAKPVPAIPAAAPALPAVPAPAPVATSALAALPAPSDPLVLDLAGKLGHAPDSDGAKVLAVWQKHLKNKHTYAIAATVKELTGDLPSGQSSDAAKALNQFVQKTIKDAKAVPGWDAASFAGFPAVPAVAPDLSDFLAPTSTQVRDLATALGFSANSNEAKALNFWRNHLKKQSVIAPSLVDGLAAVKGAAKELAELEGQVPDAEFAATVAARSAFLTDLVGKVFRHPSFDAADFVAGASSGLGFAHGPDGEPVAPEEPPPSVPAPVVVPAGTQGALAGNAAPTNIKVLHWAAVLGYGPDSDQAKVLGLWQAFQQGKPTGVTPAKQVIDFLKAAGWSPAKAEVFATQVIKQALYADGFDLDDFIDKPEAGPPPVTLAPVAPIAVPTPLPAPSLVAGTALPSIPPMSALSPAGDAKAKLGGNKPKVFLKDVSGNLFLHKKDAAKIRAFGGQVASNIAALLGDATTYVPVQATGNSDDGYGSLQPMVPDVVSDLSKVPLINLTPKQILQLQRERVLDWLVSNHDSKAGNFVVRSNGDIVGIDKEQAFKFIGDDELSLDYKPNNSPPVYNTLYAAHAKGHLKFDLNSALPFIQAIEAVSEQDYVKLVQPYIDAMDSDPTGKAHTLFKIIKRKENLRSDFEKFFSTVQGSPFKFAATGPASTLAAGVLIPPKLPSLATLNHQGEAVGIGGAGEKHFFTDDNGKKYLLKLATNKSSGKPEPWKVASQVLFATVGQAVKPSTPPVGAATFAKTNAGAIQPATLQPWLGDNLKSLSGMSPASLTAAQKKDVADEHILDWLLSQHDTHPGNLLILPNGSVVGIDKEQGFKYLLPNPKWTSSTPEGDVLSTDYHPNAQYNEQPPYYNKFWGDFADNKQSFDPTVMKAAIEAVEKISDEQYVKALEPYVSTAAGGISVSAAIYDKALARKKNIRADFETFITGLYEKRTKKKGKFTFSAGWLPEGGVVTAPAATAQSLPQVPSVPSAPPPVVAAPLPGQKSVPPPVGFTPPPYSTVKKVASALGMSPDSVYADALQKLAAYNNNINDAAAQIAYLTGTPYTTALKRVKNVAKKLKDFGGWNAAVAPISASTPAPAAVAPDELTEPTPTVVIPAKPEEIAAAAATAQLALQVAANVPASLAPTGPNLAKKGVLAWILPSGTEPILRPDTDPVWEKLTAVPAEVLAGGAVFEDLAKISALDFDVMVRHVAEATHPGNLLMQNAFVQDALNRKNTTKYQVEQMLAETYREKTGEKGRFSFVTGWQAEGAKPVPIIKTVKKTATEGAEEANVKIRPWKTKDADGNTTEDDTKQAIKYVAGGLPAVQAFLTKFGLTPLGPAVEKKGSDGSTKFLLPMSKAAIANAFVSEQVTITPDEQASTADKIAPHSGTPSYFPSHAPAVPIAQSFKDINNTKTAKLGLVGRAFPTDGPALWGSTGTLNIKRVTSPTGVTKLMVTFKLRDAVVTNGKTYGYKNLLHSGTGVEHGFWTGTYDAETDSNIQTGAHSLEVSAREWSDGKHKLRMMSDEHSYWSFAGTCVAELELGPDEKITDVLKGLLDKASPGLGDAVMHEPTPEDREIQRLHQILFSAAPAIERGLQPEHFTAAELKAKAKLAKVPEVYFTASETEVTPGIKSFFVPDRWKTFPKDEAGEPVLKFLETSASTPKFIIQALRDSGPSGINQRVLSGTAKAGGPAGSSVEPDLASGGAQTGMWRLITTNSAKQSLFHANNQGNVSGRYKYILAADELDRLDVMSFPGDAYGSFGKASGKDEWDTRKTTAEVIKRRDAAAVTAQKASTYDKHDACASNETDFFNGVHGARVLRIVTQSESDRVELIREAHKQKLTAMNGVPIEDFVVVETGPAQAIYDKYVKPMGL